MVPQSVGKSRGGLTTKIHVIVADIDLPIVCRLSSGSAADDPEGRLLMEQIPKQICSEKPLLMDLMRGIIVVTRHRISEIQCCGMRPVVPPKSNRKEPWAYDTEQYKGRNEMERNFRFVKEFRRIFTRYDKLDVMYSSFVMFAMVREILRRSCQHDLRRFWRKKCVFYGSSLTIKIGGLTSISWEKL